MKEKIVSLINTQALSSPKLKDRLEAVLKTVVNKKNFTKFHRLPLKKQAAVVAYFVTVGNKSATANLIGMTRRQLYNWIDDDPVFAEIIDTLDPRKTIVELSETVMLEQLFSENEEIRHKAAKFNLLTQGKAEGYSYRDQNEGPTESTRYVLYVPEMPEEPNETITLDDQRNNSEQRRIG